MPSILIVDDDPHIREVIRFALEDAAMTCAEAPNGQRALVEIDRHCPDLVVLDVGMPEMDGFATCRAIRARSTIPVLFLTARDDEIDRVLGFEMGADDYVSKPFSPRELALRIRAILSRGRTPPQARQHGDLAMDPDRHLCRIGAATIDLTGTEFALLFALIQTPDRIRSRDALVRAVHGEHTQVSDRTVDSHIRNIRAKAARAGLTEIIVTVHGIGVKLGPCRV